MVRLLVGLMLPGGCLRLWVNVLCGYVLVCGWFTCLFGVSIRCYLGWVEALHDVVW